MVNPELVELEAIDHLYRVGVDGIHPYGDGVAMRSQPHCDAVDYLIIAACSWVHVVVSRYHLLNCAREDAEVGDDAEVNAVVQMAMFAVSVDEVRMHVLRTARQILSEFTSRTGLYGPEVTAGATRKTHMVDASIGFGMLFPGSPRATIVGVLFGHPMFDEMGQLFSPQQLGKTDRLLRVVSSGNDRRSDAACRHVRMSLIGV